jgi:hypothetical protein
LVRWVRLGAGSTLVPSPSPETSPAASSPPVSASPALLWLAGGSVDPWVPRVSACGCTAPGVFSVFTGEFLKELRKMISQNYETALKNHISRFIAPKMMKQILKCSS